VKSLVARYPLPFAVLVTLAAYALDAASRLSLPSKPVSSASDLPPAALEPPTETERVLTALRSSETTYWLLTILLALALVALLGWWREAGINERPHLRRALPLALFPLLTAALALSGGMEVLGPGFLIAALLGALLVALGEELLFRGVVLRALAPIGARRAVALTALLSGVLWYARSAAAGPGPEAVLLAALAVGGGFVYGALRWRLSSVWPAFVVHAVLAFVVAVSAPAGSLYLLFLLLSTFGFVLYGLFLLRKPAFSATR
jgi:membrane protease YdiL (CAAX protease family)